jgi:hypothetical protein
MATIPEKYLDLLAKKKAFAALATTMPDGSPQVTPVWFDYKDGLVRVNTAKGRVKARNLKKARRWRLRSSIRTIRTAMSRFAVGSGGSPKQTRTRTSIRWPRNISGRTSIPMPRQAKCA